MFCIAGSSYWEYHIIEDMAEGGAEKEKEPAITVETVLQSIEENEKWWEQLQGLMKQGVPVAGFLSRAIDFYKKLELAAQDPNSSFPKTTEDVSKVKALWVIAAPGTYFQARKNDRYADKEWALWNDRRRINHALQIGRKLAEVKLGHPISDNWVETERELTEQGPLIVYNGSPSENAAVLEAKNTPWLRMPQDNIYPGNKIMVISPKSAIENTADQIRSFYLPPAFEINLGDEIGLVIHAPQAVRFLYMLANFKDVIPNGVNLRIFSLPTPESGFPEYPLQELRGTAYYRFIADPQIAADSPYPVANDSDNSV